MPDAPHIPRLRLHRASNQGRVWLAGRWVYCGVWSTDACHERYRELLASHLRGVPGVLTVADLHRRFMLWAKSEYSSTDRSHGGESTNFRYALVPLVEVCGTMPSGDMDAPTLRRVRDAMVERGWSRRHINRSVNRCRQMFRWAAEEGLLPASVCERMSMLRPLRAGRPGVVDRDRVKSAPIPHIRAAQQYANPPVVAEMVELLLLTGMRIGELCPMTAGDIDTSGVVWRYTVERHKTRHHTGEAKVVWLGAKSQDVIRPRLRPDLSAPIFTNRNGRPYTPRSFRKRIVAACEKAGVPEFTTHQIRHSRATELLVSEALRRVKAATGHASDSAALVYADAHEVQRELARLYG